MDISTIVFHGDWDDETDYGSTMVRKYGLSDDIDDPSNTQIVQADGKNYPTMIADISSGGWPAKVRYIHWQASTSFKASAVNCYEKKRLYASDMENGESYEYILPQNGGIKDLHKCYKMKNKEQYINYNSDRTIWRAVVLNPYPIAFSEYAQQNVKKFEMDQNNSDDKKTCEYDPSENGYDCYKETNNNR